MTKVLGRMFSIGARQSVPMDYEEAKALATHSDTRKRYALAKRRDVQPEILYYLAADPELEVRREIAGNRSAPAQADAILSGDSDDGVRCRVAVKIAKVAPSLTDDERAKVGSIVFGILETLTQDQLPRVRRILSEELKGVSNVPSAVIERLARDSEAEVAGPVLEHSPMLSDDVLIEVIESGPVRGIVGAIARRRGLGADVSDAVVATDDEEVITALLSNASAQIREEALDALVDRAPDVPVWHTPLVGRPALSSRAVVRLSSFVAESLLDRLRDRQDIDAGTAAAVSAAVRERLEQGGADPVPDGHLDDDPEGRAETLHAEGCLDEDAIMAALGRGERAFVTAALSLKSDMPRAAVQKAVSLASAKGVTAITWKAGLTMAHAAQFQLRLARIAPSKVLKPGPDGAFPMSADEMAWQLEFFES